MEDHATAPARPAIDVVLFHVDGLVPGYRELYESHCGPIKPCQVRDLGELRYVLRSIARYAPWVNRLHLVVQDRRHAPEWIDPETVRVVEHADFIPEEYLPTFQVSTIQGHLHRIEGLAERCVQWCDDYFLGAPVRPDFYFDRSGNPRNRVYDSPIWPVLGRFRSDLYMRSLLNTRRMLHEALSDELSLATRACFLFPHLPVAIRVPWWAEMVESLRRHPWFEETITRKARGDDPKEFHDIIVDISFVNWVDMVKRPTLSAIRYLRCASVLAGRLAARASSSVGAPMLYGTYKIQNDPARTRRAMDRLLRHTPRFYCVNDDAYDRYVADDGSVFHDGFAVHPGSLKAFHETVESLLPTVCKYERGFAEGRDALP